MRHYYPPSYGTKQCMANDETLPPDCADASGQPKPDAPAWCSSRWCYVHKEICDQADVKQSLYFGQQADLWYSYEKCGGADLFTATACPTLKTQGGCISPCVWVAGSCMDPSTAAKVRAGDRYALACTHDYVAEGP